MSLPAWPERPFFDDTSDFDWCSYERARYRAAMARLRVAVEALELYAHCVAQDHHTADATLQTIGPLPPAASSAEQQPGRGGA